MSSARLITSYDSSNIHLLTHHKAQASLQNPHFLLRIPRLKHGNSFLENQGFLCFTISQEVLNRSQSKKVRIFCNSVEPGSLPSSGSPNSWRNFIIGMLLSVILPFWKNKWGPLIAFKREVDTVIEAAESVTDVVEKVAEEVEKVADELGDRLPECGKLKRAVSSVENMAKEIDKAAEQVGDFIDKVEKVEDEVEKRVETFMESLSDKENMATVPKQE